ncbi:MAG: protoheme IX farnesyltransferase [Nitrospinae bacterium]|nr:protoheme IX farnesyltransferase [Nitrospinota bacterium]
MSGRVSTAEARQISLKGVLLDHLALVKPGIIALVIVSALAGMYIAQRGLPAPALVFWTLLGTAFSTAGAAALNNYIDRDIDFVMRRTSGRPLPSGLISPLKALYCGLALSAISVVILTAHVNKAAALYSTAALFIYVIPYTLMTKRSTPLATFVGGVGGALPPVIGYAAIKPVPDIWALTLFLIIFAWQHPHFWSLALKYMDEYKSAGVMNLPVKRGVDETKRQIAIWAFVLAAVSILPYVVGMAGLFYLAGAMAAGVLFFSLSLWFVFSGRKVAMSLFFFSLVHLPLLYCLIIVDIR